MSFERDDQPSPFAPRANTWGGRAPTRIRLGPLPKATPRADPGQAQRPNLIRAAAPEATNTPGRILSGSLIPATVAAETLEPRAEAPPVAPVAFTPESPRPSESLSFAPDRPAPPPRTADVEFEAADAPFQIRSTRKPVRGGSSIARVVTLIAGAALVALAGIAAFVILGRASAPAPAAVKVPPPAAAPPAGLTVTPSPEPLPAPTLQATPLTSVPLAPARPAAAQAEPRPAPRAARRPLPAAAPPLVEVPAAEPPAPAPMLQTAPPESAPVAPPPPVIAAPPPADPEAPMVRRAPQ